MLTQWRSNTGPFYKMFFNYDGYNITNIDCKLYSAFEEMENDTKNIHDNPNITITDFNISDLTNNSDVQVDEEEGTITFG
jgi:hypothetical protein